MKKILFALACLVGLVFTASAQEKIYLVKGNTLVATYDAAEVDYLTFELTDDIQIPAPLTIKDLSAGKNTVTYTITPYDPTAYYVHGILSESYLDYLLQEYFDSSLAEADEATLYSAIVFFLQYYGYAAQGSQTFTIRDGATDNDGNEFEVLAGQKYYIVAVELDLIENELTENFTYQTITTEPAAQSNATLTVTYTGLNDEGQAMFNFGIDEDIIRIYTCYGYKETLDPYIAEFGLEYTVFLFGEIYSPEELTDYTIGWPVNKKAEYVMYAIGIDSNGDHVTASCSQEIEPLAQELVGPQINIFTKTKGDGKVSVNFEITPSNVTEAYVRLMTENNVDDRLNMGYTLAELAQGGDAEDITSAINTYGEYTYTNNDVPSGWQSLLIMGKNADGTTVTRINFEAYNENSEWDLNENQPVKASAPAARTAKRAFAPQQTNGNHSLPEAKRF